MNHESAHLDLAELLAEVNGEAADDAAREHLATCERCRAEAGRWGTAARGVRDLAAHAHPPDAALPALPALPRQARRPTRTVLVTSAAAGILLLGAASYGLANALTGAKPAGPGGGSGSAGTTAKLAGVNAVAGCATLDQASGTLEQVSGTSLVIKTSGGQPVTVTTSADTTVHDADASPDVITDGAPVTVVGHGSDGTIAAAKVAIGSPPPPSRHATLDVPPGLVAAKGTVADASTGGFTVVTPGGTQVPVTISGKTEIVLRQVTVSQLQSGGTVVAFGYAGKNETLAAIDVVQIPAGASTSEFAVRSCSSASVDGAITAALAFGG